MGLLKVYSFGTGHSASERGALIAAIREGARRWPWGSVVGNRRLLEGVSRPVPSRPVPSRPSPQGLLFQVAFEEVTTTVPPMWAVGPGRLALLGRNALVTMDPDRTSGLLREHGLEASALVDGVEAATAARWRGLAGVRVLRARELPDHVDLLAGLGPWARVTFRAIGLDPDTDRLTAHPWVAWIPRFHPRRAPALGAALGLSRRCLERASVAVLGVTAAVAMERVVAMTDLDARHDGVPSDVRCRVAGHTRLEALARRVRHVVASEDPWLEQGLAARGLTLPRGVSKPVCRDGCTPRCGSG